MAGMYTTVAEFFISIAYNMAFTNVLKQKNDTKTSNKNSREPQ